MIRCATSADVPALVEMGVSFIATVYPDQFATNRDQLTALCDILRQDAHSLLLVAERDGQIVGMLGAHAYAHMMSGEHTAAELFWWMNPTARGDGLKLYRAFEKWARRHGAQILQMGAPNLDVARVYERLGFQRVETTYARRLA